MKTRIVNNEPKGNYTDEWIESNSDIEVNGQLVSNWELVPLYEGSFIKPMWNGIDYYEAATSEEIELFNQTQIDKSPTLVALYASEIGYSVNREIDIQIDQLEIFTPKEKVYHLLGYPLFKEYFKDDVCVCRLEYQKVYEDKTHEGITKNEFVGTKTVFKFYKDEAKQHFITKEKQTKTFALVPTTIHDENDNVIDVLWSSADREGLLRAERYKSEQVMKSFNPKLYQLFAALWNDLYMIYKETGENTELINSIQSHPLPKLDEEVEDDDKAIVFGQMEVYPPLTIRQLIINALP